MAKKNSTFGGNYRKYDASQGYGNPEEWRDAFYQRMSGEEARHIVEEAREGPWAILGVPMGATQQEIKSAFRLLIMRWHPDKNPGREEEAKIMSQKIIAAYTIISNNYD